MPCDVHDLVGRKYHNARPVPKGSHSGEREPVFGKRVQTILDMEDSINPVPRNLRIISGPGLDDLFAGYRYGDLETRNRIIKDAFKLYAYTQSELAAFLTLSRSAISKIICKTK